MYTIDPHLLVASQLKVEILNKHNPNKMNYQNTSIVVYYYSFEKAKYTIKIGQVGKLLLGHTPPRVEVLNNLTVHIQIFRSASYLERRWIKSARYLQNKGQHFEDKQVKSRPERTKKQ